MDFTRRKLLASAPAAAMLPFGLNANPLSAFSPNNNRNENGNEKVIEATYTKSSEKAARKGLDWLKKVANRDGGYGVDVGQTSDIGCSCMVGLAMMARGTTPIEGAHRAALRKTRAYVIKQTEKMPSNDITAQENTQLQRKIGRHAHSFFASLFLSQVMGLGTDPSIVKPAIKKVVKAVVKAQSSNGDWGSTSWAPTLGTVMGWVSLRAADFAGLSVGGAPEKTAEHLIEKMSANLNQSRGWMHDLYKNASGIRVLYAMQMEDKPITKKAFADALRLVSKDNTPFTQAGGEEFLAFHLITETMLKKGGKDWNKWYPVVRDKLIKVQNNDGSWVGHHCITSRTFCTAAAILVLTAPYRYLPISQA